MNERKGKLEAGVVFLNMIVKADYSASGGPEMTAATEERLKKALAEAQANLEGFQKAKAARLALNEILPGWVEVEISDHLPRRLWHSFVSNDQSEWLDWLLENGVVEKVAKELVRNAWKDRKS